MTAIVAVEAAAQGRVTTMPTRKQRLRATASGEPATPSAKQAKKAAKSKKTSRGK
jgi:hypothetical protein